MPAAATQGDSIRILSGGVEVEHLHAVGTIHGVAIRQVAAACGEGVGRISSANAGMHLRWQAPGSATAGASVDVSAGGQFLLLDGESTAKWIRIEAYTAQMLASPQAAQVILTAVYNNAIGSDNVSAAEAAAGDVETWTLTLQNDSATPVADITVWIDAATAGMEISDDGATWVAPTSEATGLDLGDLAAAATVTLHLRRTISAGAPADPDVTNLLHYSFTGN